MRPDQLREKKREQLELACEKLCEEALLRKVGDSNVVNISEATVDPKQFKVNEVKEAENEWKQKRMHGQHVREKEDIDWDGTWQ